MHLHSDSEMFFKTLSPQIPVPANHMQILLEMHALAYLTAISLTKTTAHKALFRQILQLNLFPVHISPVP